MTPHGNGPILWRGENEQIPNPHWIYPGERIRLFRKSDHQMAPPPVVKDIPPVQPQVEATTPKEETPPEVYFYYPSMDKVGFIRKPAVQPSGVIFKSMDDKKLISINDTVYIRHPDNKDGTLASDMSPGSRWTIYRTMKPTDDRESESTIGTQHYLVGVLEIVKNEGPLRHCQGYRFPPGDQNRGSAHAL